MCRDLQGSCYSQKIKGKVDLMFQAQKPPQPDLKKNLIQTSAKSLGGRAQLTEAFYSGEMPRDEDGP